jgi:hypothetical protein
VWSNDPERYADGSVAIGRGFPVGQVKGDGPGEKRHPGTPGWGVGRGGNHVYPIKELMFIKPQRHLAED